jgi:hypothetical protein
MRPGAVPAGRSVYFRDESTRRIGGGAEVGGGPAGGLAGGGLPAGWMELHEGWAWALLAGGADCARVACLVAAGGCAAVSQSSRCISASGSEIRMCVRKYFPVCA